MTHLPPQAQAIYETVQGLSIISPHGHCDPSWWADDLPFPDPAELLIIPDHYVFRMLYSQGIPLQKLGVGVARQDRNPREIFRLFASNWHLFLGTPSRGWLDHTFRNLLEIETPLCADTSDAIFDQICQKIQSPDFRPRALFDRMNIDVLATTDAATDQLSTHSAIHASGWTGRIIPTFRPDDILNPARPSYASSLQELAEQTGEDVTEYAAFLRAISKRRAFFRQMGATATDHDVPIPITNWLSESEINDLHARASFGTLNEDECNRYYGHLLIEMAQMAADDGMVMQIHAGSRRNTNPALMSQFGPDMGADIPLAVNWVDGLQDLLARVGNDPNLQILLFTLDESTYARELAPMAGHWPCLRIGPPWWFHDSLNGMRRYFDNVVETAGYFNLAGFNDDTRAFLSIPARHDTWRRAVSIHLADQIERGAMVQADALRLAPYLCRDQAIDAYRLPGERSA